MKTTPEKTNNIVKGLKQLTLILIIALSNLNSYSQITEGHLFGVTVKSSCSMGGLGSTTAPQLSYSYNRHEVSLGLNIQNKHTNVTGFRTGYSFVLNPADDIEVFLFCELAYFYKAFLSNRTVKFETKINSEKASYFQNVKINASEQYLGFGVNFFKSGPVNFFGAIGGGFYTTYGIKDNFFGYRDLYSTSVMLTFGAQYKI